MKHFLFYITFFVFSINVKSQDINVIIGTDFPYQHYAGLTLQKEKIDISFKTGILIPPYSDVILDGLKKLGTDAVYIEILKPAFKFGWMNSLGAYYKLGENKTWYIGPEFRLDYLTASETPSVLIEAITGESVTINNLFLGNAININFGLKLYALGFRFGKSFMLDANEKFSLNIELSAYKHIAARSVLKTKSKLTSNLNKKLDELLWEDVFKKNGYIGGLGLSFRYYLFE